MIRTVKLVLAAAIVAAAGVASSACSTDAFCFECGASTETGGAGGLASSGGHGGGLLITGGSGGRGAAGGGVIVGNDCTADTTTDPKNCGACGNACAAPNADAKCDEGVCKFTCVAGHFDQDGDLAKASTDGCEYSCNKTSTTELCNGLDDNCNNQVDEGGVCNDALNCGSFGHACLFANSQGDCKNGMCEPTTCKPGFHDKAGEPSPNCDYACNTTNNGKEICDGLDNDCNGQIDDNADVKTDPLHCGSCTKNCIGAFANSTPTCNDGQCALGECASGYFDLDGDPSNGCEYTCKAKCNFPFAAGVCAADGTCSMGMCLPGHVDLDGDTKDGCECAETPAHDGLAVGTEICDGLDNDCNGVADDPFDLQDNVDNCGSCGFKCGPFFPNANAKCVGGMCAFDSCLPGFSAPDGNTSAGCQYMCVVDPTNAVEICDGKDNDCDGNIDNVPPPADPTTLNCNVPGASGVCVPGTMQCQNGATTCVGNTTASPEVCDGIDNDCDGAIDDAPVGDPLPGSGALCGKSQIGVCALGSTVCQNGSFVCNGEVDPSPKELCNGLDDDCDGIIDDNPDPASLASCTGNAKGICKAGTPICSGGTTVCVGAILPATEVCDGNGTAGTGQDENCNGTTDEGCLFVSGQPTRRDTNGSGQSADSTFSLTTASTPNAAGTASELLAAYADTRGGDTFIWARTSLNTGTDWGSGNDFVVANDAGKIQVEPKLFTRPGRAYIAYSRFEGDVRRPWVATAASPFTTWTHAEVYTPATTTNDEYTPMGVVAKAGATATTDALAVVWSEISGTGSAPIREIFVSYSLNSGATWKAPIHVNSDAGSTGHAEQPVIATNGAGVVYLAWQDKRTGTAASVYFASIDVTKATPALSADVAIQAKTASAEDISITASASSVNVAWLDFRAAAKQVRVASSQDGGTTWTKVGGVNDGLVIADTVGQNSDSGSPTIQTSSKNVIAAWEDTRSGLSDIRFNWSTDGGATWQTTPNPRIDTGDGLGQSASFTPQLAFGQGTHVFATWRDLHFPQAAIVANESLDGGATWHPSALTTFRMDVGDGKTPATSNFAANDAADSQTPFILASQVAGAGAAQATVVWIDYVKADHTTGPNGDVYTRLMK